MRKKVTTLFITLFAVLIVQGEDEMYTTKYDNIEVDAIITNDGVLTKYVNCLLDILPCPPDAAELKKNLPEAIENDCAKCSEKQKMMTEKIMHYLIDNKLDEWMKLEAKYDPEGEYRESYLSEKAQQEKSI